MEYYRLQELQYVYHRETMLVPWFLFLFTEDSSYSKYSWFIFYILENLRYILLK